MSKERPKTILERMDNLDTQVDLLSKRYDELWSTFQQSNIALAESISGIIKASGEGFREKVDRIVEEDRLKRAQAQAAQRKAQLDQLLAAKIYIPTDTIKADSLVIGRVFDKDGNVVGAGYEHFRLELLKEEIRSKMMEQTVGFIYEAPDGQKLEILEIYDLNPNRPPPTPQEPNSEPAVTPVTTSGLDDMDGAPTTPPPSN